MWIENRNRLFHEPESIDPKRLARELDRVSILFCRLLLTAVEWSEPIAPDAFGSILTTET